jgi:hypothetical protein
VTDAFVVVEEIGFIVPDARRRQLGLRQLGFLFGTDFALTRIFVALIDTLIRCELALRGIEVERRSRFRPKPCYRRAST